MREGPDVVARVGEEALTAPLLPLPLHDVRERLDLQSTIDQIVDRMTTARVLAKIICVRDDGPPPSLDQNFFRVAAGEAAMQLATKGLEGAARLWLACPACRTRVGASRRGSPTR